MRMTGAPELKQNGYKAHQEPFDCKNDFHWWCSFDVWLHSPVTAHCSKVPSCHNFSAPLSFTLPTGHFATQSSLPTTWSSHVTPEMVALLSAWGWLSAERMLSTTHCNLYPILCLTAFVVWSPTWDFSFLPLVRKEQRALLPFATLACVCMTMGAQPHLHGHSSSLGLPLTPHAPRSSCSPAVIRDRIPREPDGTLDRCG